MVLHSLGDMALERGEHECAVAWYRECLGADRPEGEILTVAASLVGVASAALFRGLAFDAARLASAAEANLRRAGIAELRPKERRTLERTEAKCRALLPADLHVVATADGRTMSVDEATVLAMSLRLAPAPGERIALTRRESEILPRLAEGQTHRVIARDLFISERTVNSHVARLYAKLKVRSRAEAVKAGVDRGLIDPPAVGPATDPVAGATPTGRARRIDGPLRPD